MPLRIIPVSFPYFHRQGRFSCAVSSTGSGTVAGTVSGCVADGRMDIVGSVRICGLQLPCIRGPGHQHPGVGELDFHRISGLQVLCGTDFQLEMAFFPDLEYIFLKFGKYLHGASSLHHCGWGTVRINNSIFYYWLNYKSGHISM
ncbi:MAG TPA: hypothetical protein DCY35_00820 [Prolixibacteraceae bacterium]|nr:hypothetical protein [Prolixibacteraceae bacterium]